MFLPSDQFGTCWLSTPSRRRQPAGVLMGGWELVAERLVTVAVRLRPGKEKPASLCVAARRLTALHPPAIGDALPAGDSSVAPRRPGPFGAQDRRLKAPWLPSQGGFATGNRLKTRPVRAPCLQGRRRDGSHALRTVTHDKRRGTPFITRCRDFRPAPLTKSKSGRVYPWLVWT